MNHYYRTMRKLRSKPESGHSNPQAFRLQRKNKLQTGLTLIEILISLSISAILTGLAVGSVSTINNFANVSEVNNLIADLYYSRSEALKRRSTITICRTDGGDTCNKGSGWEKGWIIFTDKNRNRKIDGNDRLLQIRDGLKQSAKLTLGSGYYYYIMFSDTGEAYPRNTFKFCPKSGQPKAIILFSTGRARISHKNSSGKPLKC